VVFPIEEKKNETRVRGGKADMMRGKGGGGGGLNRLTIIRLESSPTRLSIGEQLTKIGGGKKEAKLLVAEKAERKRSCSIKKNKGARDHILF